MMKTTFPVSSNSSRIFLISTRILKVDFIVGESTGN
jgi:hypothetical protein